MQKSFGKKRVLQLSFEESLARKLERRFARGGTPHWTSGGFRMTSLLWALKALGAGTLQGKPLGGQ